MFKAAATWVRLLLECEYFAVMYSR
jgi:hypothetical protein